LDIFTNAFDLVKEVLKRFSIVEDESDSGRVWKDFDESSEEVGGGVDSDALGFVKRVCETFFSERIICCRDCDRGQGAALGHDLPIDTEKERVSGAALDDV